VPVPGAAVVRETRDRELPPHVTVLFPFIGARRVDDAVLGALADVLGVFERFEFALTEVCRFPGVLYLAPEPAERFRSLTSACVQRWPQCPPYAGAHEKLVPHLTLAEGPEPPGLARRAAGLLPIHAVAEEVWLMTRGRTGRWDRRAVIELGSPRSG